ncbi:hydroxymethylbilane synthase [Chondrinema litorale]|uniref:hydroxymethylbilane synthase n=1 Tax=Chondrinema litorale TaxID=2994555 RepID=UPI00254452E9|nr:hydroxymethylbilane synthase [Chondrinema litorale]UZR92630.1 hydroxymethylbilane synthase [Chondrinema litorale]
MKKIINIGTRGSKLALWQAYYVEELLVKAGYETNIVIIETKGDKILDRSLAKVGSKGIFTEELETQLLEGKIDIAVHSAKDMPSDLGEHFKIIAFTEREQVNDVIISDNKALFEKDKIVLGTSSVRRTALLKKYMPEAEVVNMRGNLQTRIRKMQEGQCDALVLAFAGVHRMGYDNMIVKHLPADVYIPPVGQGSVAIEAAVSIDSEVEKSIVDAINHTESALCLLAERAFLHKLQGGCSIPAFASASISENNSITIKGGVISLDGKELIASEQTGKTTEAETLGKVLAEEILNSGGREILASIKAQ